MNLIVEIAIRWRTKLGFQNLSVMDNAKSYQHILSKNREGGFSVLVDTNGDQNDAGAHKVRTPFMKVGQIGPTFEFLGKRWNFLG